MTVLTQGDIAIIHASADGADQFSFVLQRDIDAGTVINFTDNGWRAAGGFRSGEGTVTYTASAAMAAGSVITLSGLDLDAAGDQIIAYQGDAATPTILYLVDFADGNNTVAGDATDANTTALPPGFTLGVNAVAVGFDNAIYAGPIDGSPPQLFPLISNSANWIDGNALPPSFRYFYPPHLDLDANNSTSGGVDYLAEVTNDSSPVPISDTDSDIDDFDGGIITFAQITINNPFPGDVLSVIGTLPFGILATPFDPFTGTLSLIGLGSHSAYQTAIEQIGFSTDAPVGVTKSISVWVFDDFWWSNEAHARFTVTSADEPPDLDLDANNSTGFGVDATATYTAGGAAVPVTDTDVLVTDDGGTIQSAKINILDYSLHMGDTLSIAGTLPTGITASSYNPFTGIITLSGSASLAAYQTALRQVVFSSTLGTPSTQNRDIQVSVNDGFQESNFATMHMHVVIPPPNATPLLDLDFNNSTTTGANYLTGFTESAPPVPVAIVDADVQITDLNNLNLASATITLTNPQAGDHLTFAGTPPPGILVFGSGTNLITLTGVASQGNYELALRQIRYSNDSVDPSNVTRTIEIVVNDGTINSNTATALVQVEAVNNSAPVIDLDPNDSSASTRTTFRTIFTENGSSTPIADTDVSITDLDSTTLVSATITLANQQAGDLLTVIGSLPGLIVASPYDPATGVLTLTGAGTHAEYEVALLQVRYSNPGDDPATEDRLIEVVVSDGVNTSNVAAAVITVVAVNDPPVLTVDPSATYVENAGDVTLSPLAALTDLDSAELSQVIVTITDGLFLDTLTIGGVTGGNVNGILFVFEAAEHAMVMTGASSLLNYQNLLQTVGFRTNSDNPTDFGASTTRTLTWTVSDGAAVATATTTLNIVAVNDAPQATVAATASYTENAAPVVLSPASTVTDVDNITLVAGEVRIVSGALDGDLLTVNGLQSGTFAGINFSYDAVLHDLRFTGPTTVADYQAFLQAVAFSSTSDNPTDSGLDPTRTLSWFVYDGQALSAVQTTVVSITALADPPVNTVPGAQSVNEDTPLPIAGVSVADPDSATLTTTLTVLHGRLHVTAGTGVSNNDTGSVTIAGTLAEINAALAGLSYTGNLNFNGLDTLTVTTGDGTAQDIDTVAITVNPVNDAPVAQNGSASGNEDTPIGGTLVATDVDGPALAYALGAQATNGTVVVNSDGTYTYTPNLNFNGTDSFTFTASDGTIGSNTATVTLTVAAVNDAPVAQNGSASGNEDTPINGTLVATDVESPTLSYALGAQAANGTVVVNTDGSYTYTPNLNFNGTDSFTFTASDGTIGSNTATVTLTVNPVNDAPVAQDGSASGNEDTPIGGTLVATDVESPVLTYALGAQATNGTVVVNTDGSYTYTPNLNFNGSDSFTFTASDGTVGSNTATVTLTVAAVNDAPVAQNGSANGSEDTPINGTLVATDVDNLTLTYALGAQAANGTVVVNTDGSYTYTPNLNFNGSDSFTFTASDGTIGSNTATVTLTVAAVNDAPVNTVPGAQTAQEDTPLLIAGLSVADVDSPTLTVTLSAGNGSVAIVPGLALLAGNLSDTVTISGTLAEVNLALASVYYLGDPNFVGSDTLTITTSDSALSDSDTVAITVAAVADAPVLDLDADNSSGAPGSGYVTTFTENGSPVALTDTDLVLTDVDSPNLAGATFVLLNAQAGDALVVTGSLPGGISAVVTGNQLTLSGSASVADYKAALALIAFENPGDAPDPQDRLIQVTVNDGTKTTSAFTLVQIVTVNDAPLNTVPGPQAVNEDTALPIPGVSVADAENAPLTTTLTVTSGTLSVATGGGATIGGNGTAIVTLSGSAAQINAALAGLAYTGNLNFNGPDTLTVTTGDGAAQDIDTVAITVNPVNDAPVNTVPGSQSVNEDTALPIPGVSVADVDGPALTTTLTVASGTLTVTTGGGATIGGNGTAAVTLSGSAAQINAALAGLAYTGTLNFNGPDTLTVTTGDGAAQDVDTVAITVNPVNDAPVNTVPGAQAVNEDTPLPIPGVSVADVENAPLTTTLTVSSGTLSVTTGGGATIGGNGTAIVTLSGSATQINAALAGLSYTGNLNFNGPDTLTVTTGDGAAQDIDTVAITVNPVNDAPVNTVPGAQSVNEDVLLPIPGVSVADVDGTPLTTTLTVTSGTLSVTTGGGATIGGNGSAAVTLSGSAAQINAALAGLAYTGNLNFNGPDTLTVTTGDGTAQDVDTIAITVNPVNDAPVNTVPGAQTVNEDTALPIAGVSVADADGSPLTTTLTVTSGTLSVTTGGGATIGGNGSAAVTLSGSATQINAALAGLSYTGNLNFNGPDTLTVTTGDGTAQDIDTVAITVNPVNDAPVNTVPGAQTAQEDTPLLIAGLSVADVDSPTLTVTVSALNGSVAIVPGLALVAGNLTNTVTISGTLAEVNLALAGVHYLGNPNFAGSDTLTVTTSDSLLNDIDTVAITVAAIADAPVLDLDADNSSGAPGSGYVTTFTENGSPVALTATDLLLTDVDSPNLAGATFRLLNAQAGDVLLVTGSLPTGISAVVTGNQLTLSGSALVADYRAALALIAFNNPGDAPAPQDRLIQVTVNDGTKTTSAFTLVHLAVTNDAPVNTVPGPQSVNEDATLSIAGVSVVDADSPALTTTLTVTSGRLNVATGGGATIGGNGTAAVTLSGSATQINAALAGLSYTGNLDFNGPDTLTVTTGDGTAQDIDTVAITVNPVNDAPVNTVPGPQSVNEDTALPIAGVSVADVDGPALTTTLTVTSGRLNVATGGGATIGGNGSAIVTLSGSAAQINAALAGLSYTGNLDFNGSDTLTVTTGDGTAQDIDTVAITVNPLNDAPVNTVPGPQSVNEDTALPIAGVSVADVDSASLTTTLTVTSGRLNVATGGGATIGGNGTAAVTLSGSAAQINAALAGLSYTGNLNFNGSDTLTVTTGDGTAQDIDTVAITVNPVNDAPVNTVPGAQSVNEDATLPIAGVSVADVDSASLTTTLTVTSGTLNVATGGGATIGGNGSAAVTLSGSATQINAALAGLSYTGNLNFNGSDTLTVTTGDGTAQDVDTIAITVNPLNDAPVNTVPGAQVVNEDVLLPIAGVSVADADGTPLTTTLTVTSGTLSVTTGGGATIGGNGSAAVTLSGSATQINAALAGLSYTGNLNFNGSDTLTVTTGDGTAQDIDTVAITVNPVNDAPVNTVPGAQTAQEDTPLLIAGLSVADVDSPTLTVTLSALNGSVAIVPGLALVAGNLTNTVTISGTLAEVNLALAGVHYLGNPNFAGSDTLTVTTSDSLLNDIDTVAITVAAIADAPVLDLDADNSSGAPGSGYVTTFTENGSPVALTDIVDLVLTDADSPNLAGATFRLLNAQAGDVLLVTGSLPTGISAVVTGNQLTLSGSALVADYRAALALIAFNNPGDAPAPQDRLIRVTVNDGTKTTSAFTLVHITTQNDAPVNTVPGAQSVAEDTLLPIPGVSVADAENAPLTTTLMVSSGTLNVATGGGATIGGNGTAAVTLSGSATQINAALAGLSYTGNLNFNGPDTLTVTTGDGTVQDIDTVAITVNPVNDAPVNTVPGPQSVNEDTALPIAGVSVADVDGPALTTTLTVTSGRLNVATGGGATIGGNGTAAVTLSGSAAQINAALAGLSYTGNLDFNGSDTLSVITGDGTAQDVDTVAITVNPLNDAPVNTVPGPQSVNEDVLLPITGVSVADADGTPLTTTLTVSSGKLSVTTGGGATIGGNGSAAVTLSGSAAQINAALAGLSYTGNLNFNGSDTLTVTTGDGTAQDVDTVAITVNPVNDAPVNTVPGPQSVNEDVLLPITGVSIADVDSASLTTTLTVTSGTLNVTTGGGATIGGNGTAAVTLSGSAAQINAALAGLAYTGNLNFNGSDTLTVTTSDSTAQDVDTIAITVNPLNDAPVNTVPGAQVVNEDVLLPITGVLVADADGTALTTTLTVSSGTLSVTLGGGATIGGNGSAAVTLSGSAAQINAALAGLSYTGTLNFNGPDTLTVTTGDGTAQDVDTVAITVSPVNDAPVNTVPGPQTAQEDTPLLIPGLSVADVDSPSLTVTVSALNGSLAVVPGLALLAGNLSNSVTISGTLAEVNLALASVYYLGNPNFFGADTLTVTTSDGTAQDVDTVAITVNAVNDAPVLDLDADNSSGATRSGYITTFTENGSSVALTDIDLVLTDVDSPNLVGATFALLNAQAGDALVVTGSLPGGISAVVTGNQLTLSGSASVANYKAALALIAFENPGNAPAPRDRLILVTVNDGTATTSAFTLVQIVTVNDAPVNTVPGPQSVGEDTPLPIAGVSVADADSPALTTTLAVTSGTLNVTTGGGATIGGNGTAAVTLSGSAAQINAALVGLAYTGNLNFNGPDTLTVTTGDGTAQDIDTVAITVNPVNDVPVNTVPGSQSVAEDTLLPIPGVSVADADGGALTTTLVVTNGILNVTPGAGVTGNGTGTVTIAGTAAQINAALAGLSYTGNPDFNGSDTLTVTTSDGTAQDIDPIVITVNPVADAPVNTVPAAQSVNEDTLLAIAGVSVADADGGALSTTLTVTSGILNVTPGAGVSGNGTAVVNITGTAAEINAALAGLSYTGTLNFHGSDTLTVTTSDGTATDTDTVAITVSPVNDAPVNTVPGAQTVNEDTALPIAGVSVADVENSPLTTTLTVSSGTLNVATGGGATIGGNGSAAVTLSGSATQINAALAGLAYTGNLNFNGSDTLTVATTDDGTATDTDTVAITVSPVNDAPVNTVPGAQTVNEDTALSITGVSVADADSPALTTTLTVTSGTLNVATGGGATIGGNGSATVTLSGSAAQINAALAGLAYTGNLNFNGPDTLTVTTGDGTVQDIDTITITVNPVNDAPVNTVPGAQSVAEDTLLPIPGVSVAEVDGLPLTTTLTVTSGTLNVATGGGATIGGNGTASVTLSGSAAQINAALAGLSYTGNLNFNGSDTLTVTTGDGTAQDIDTVAITVSPVNDAPVNTVPGAQSVNEDTLLPIPGVSVADVDGLPLTTTLTVTRGTLNVATGGGATIGGNGSAAVTLSGSAAQINAALAGLAYTGTLNFNGPDTLTVTTGDGTAQDTDTVAITVNPVDDAPVNTVPGAQTVAEDTLLPIPGVSVADVDGLPLTTTLTVSSGTLSVATDDGVTIGGNGTAAVTLSGSATDVNAALAGLSYTGNLNFNGSDTLTVTTGDVPAQDIDTVAITVNPVNDAPVNTVPGAQSVAEDTLLPIAGVSVADVDGLPLTTTLTVTSGTLNVATGGGATILDNGTAAVTLSGSATQINAALAGLAYTGNLNFNGLDTLTVTTGDGTAQDTDTVAITVNPVNDPPVNTVPGPQSAVEDTPLLIAGLSVADDSPTLTVTLSVLNGSVAIVPGLALLAGNLSNTVTITGTLAEVNLALASTYYLGNPNFFGPDTLTIVTSDGALSDSDTVAIEVADTIEAPDLDLDAGAPGSGYVTTFTENGLPVALTDTDLVLADDSSTLVSATFRLLNLQAGDALVVTGPLPITISPIITGNQITLSGTASVADYTAAMKLIAFTNPGDGPAPQDRLIEVTVDDGTSTTSAFTLVHLAVTNDAPVAQDGSASGNEDTPIVGTVVAIDPDGPTLTYALAAQALHGTVVVNTDGTYTYTPNPDFNGSDTFTYTVNDGAAGSDTATVTLTVNPVNDAPVAQDGSASGDEDTPISGTVVATDVDSPALTYALGVQAANGTVMVNTDGTYTYTPKPNFNGTDSFTFTAHDGAGGSDTATVTLTVSPVNDAPVAQFGDGAVDEDTTLNGALVAIDVDGQSLTYALATQALHGAVVINPDGTGSYTPDPDFNGSDSFTYTASDGASGSNIATVSMTVNPVNDPPVNTVPGPQSVAPDTDTPITGLAIQDIDAGTNIIQTTLSVSHGTLVVTPNGGASVAGNGTNTVVVTGSLPGINATLAATGLVVYRSLAGFVGTDMLIITTTDEADASDTDTVAINVGGNAPAGIVLSNTTINEFSQDGTLVGSLAAIDADPGDTFTFALLDDAGTRFAINGTSLIVRHGLLLDFEQAAAHPITVEVTDSSGARFQQVFTIGIANVDPEIITQSDELSGPGLASVTGGITIVGGPLDDRISLAGGNDTIDAGAGNDMLIGGPGDDRLTGAAGDDTTAFTVPLGSTTPDDFGQWIDIAGADGSDRLFTIEHLQFPDGTVHVNDGDLLFDTLFYDHRYLDVFHAVVDAGQHYAEFGWHEGRDPNAFFSTTQYLSANRVFQPEPEPEPEPEPVTPPSVPPDSAPLAAGGEQTSLEQDHDAPDPSDHAPASAGLERNPLEHYRDTGWREGRDPSLLFDTTLYLIHNPDVAAAGVNPLEHFLTFGRAEGRVAYASIGQEIGPWGFDAEFYLMSNPDVAAAGVDPLQHYQESGWHEGRNPNRYFDTAGYLARYTDVAAAGINPLQHYDEFGWREGRDPSGAFDTQNYLSASPDIAAADVNPLVHFLEFGIYEGRDPFADGIFR